jgi:hypothetical protein
MNDKGWGWSASEIRQVHLVEWLAQHPENSGVDVTVEEFYRDLPDQAQNNFDTAYGDLRLLEERCLIDLFPAMGGIRALHVRVKYGCRDFATEVRAKRENKGRRRTACRDAMVDWLHALDAVTASPEMPATEAMLQDPQHGIWFAQPFTPADLDQAAAWLHEEGLVGGITAEEAGGPILLHLTDEGVRCAEDFKADTVGYSAAKRQPTTSGPSVQIGTNSGPFQVAGDYAQQVQNIGANVDELRQQISNIAESVRSLVPDAIGVDEAEQEALAAITACAVDQSVLRRFGAWARARVEEGTSAAIAAMVTAAINQMLALAGHVAGHLG